MNELPRAHGESGETRMARTPRTERSGLAALVARGFAEGWPSCGTFEGIALGYLGLSVVLIALFAERLAHPARLVGVQVLVAAIILLLCRVEAGSARLAGQQGKRFSSTFWHFWRHWYPHLFFLFCFEEMSQLVHLVNSGWEDAKLIAFDHWLTGVNPALWFEHLARPWLTEFMAFSYFTYFVYLLILGGVLYGQRDFRSYWAVMTYSAVGYVFGYLIAMLFPVQSPWFTLAGQWHGELLGGPFTALINVIEKYARVRGAAFPSQHVAGATAALWGAWRHRRQLFWIFLPFVLCMYVSTVYVRNHYVADVLAGMATGTSGFVVGSWLLKAPGSLTNAGKKKDAANGRI